MTDILPISDVRENLPKLVDQVDKRDNRIIITVNGKAKAVILSLEELESIEETAEIMAIPGALKAIKKGEKQIKKGQFIPLSKLE